MTSDLEYALIAGNAYYDNRSALNRTPAPEGWNLYSRYPNDAATGFEAVAFQRGTEIVIAYAGTDQSVDWFANGGLAFGGGAEQLRQAAEYYLEIKAVNPNAKVTLVGHSLGGGLASLIGTMFGETAKTFDQAPFRNALMTFSHTDPLTQAPIERSAAGSLLAELSGHFDGALLEPLAAYVLANSPSTDNPVAADTLAQRENLVTNLIVAGEVLDKWLPFSNVGVPLAPLTHGGADVSSTDLHSQSLLTAFLQNDGFRKVTFTLSDLLPMVFDKNLFAVDDLKKPDPNLLEHLVRHQAGGVDGIPIGGDKMLDRFAADLQKLAADAGLSVAGADLTKALIAFAMQAYYSGPHASEADRQLFKKVAGGINFDRSDVAATLEAMKGYTQYFQNHLAILPAAERALIAQYLPGLQDWYLAGSRLAATATDKTAFMLGAADTDLMIGGRQNDLLVGLGSTDLLEGGKGDDILVGGEGYDIYRYTAGDGADRLIDADRQGAILVNGGDAGGLFLRQGQSEIWINADNHLTLTHGATWKLTLADGGELDLGETLEDGDYGIRRLTLPTAPTTNATDTGSAFDDNDLDTDPDHQAVNASTSGTRLQGLAGRDQINGSGGDDILEGGSEADILAADSGNDWLYCNNEAISPTDALAAGLSGRGSGTRGDWLNGGGGDDLATFSNSGGAANDTWWRVAA